MSPGKVGGGRGGKVPETKIFLVLREDLLASRE